MFSCMSQRMSSPTPLSERKTKKLAKGETLVDQPYLSLLDYLRRQPGLSISGNENNPVILVRGMSSLVNQQPPLFVLDGTILGQSYSSVERAVDMNDIHVIRVLKSATETSRYGFQGAFGVVEIVTKKE